MELSVLSPSTVDAVDSSDTAGPCESSSRRPPSRGREPLEPLIVAALRAAPDNRLLLTDIYRYIEAHSADYRDAAATESLPSSTSTGAVVQGRRTRTKEPAWKIHVRHILSVRRDVFPLTSEKEEKRRGRYHALDELQYARRLAAKAHRGAVVNVGGLMMSGVSTSSEPTNRRRKRRSRGQVDQSSYQRSHADTENSTCAGLSAGQQWCNTVVTAEQPDSWQSSPSTDGGVQLNAVVRLPTHPVDVLYDMATECLAYETGNSRDSWSSTTSSNIAPVAEHPQYGVPLPPRQPIHYGHYMAQQQQWQVYDWTPQQRHTWPQVKTNQSGTCQQLYPHQQVVQWHQCINAPPSQTDQRPYLRPTSSRHGHPYQLTRHSSPCLFPQFPGDTTRLRQVSTAAVPVQHPATHNGWNSDGSQCSRASYGQLQPVSSQTSAPCWHRVDSNPTCTYPAASTLQQQQQHGGLLTHDNSSYSLTWSPDASCSNNFND